MNKKIIRLNIVNFALIILICILGASYYDINYVKLLFIYSLILQIINIFVNKKNNMKTIFGIFLLIYYIPVFLKVFFDYQIQPFDYTINNKDGLITLFIYSIFGIVYSIALIFNKVDKQANNNIFKNITYIKNNINLVVIIIIIALCILFGHKGSFALNGNYGSGEATRSILNEYIIIFFVIGYIYAKSIKKKMILNILVVVYCVKNILYGDRIGILMLGIAIFIMKFYEVIDIKKILIITIVSMILFAGISNIRTYGKLIINNKTKVIESNEGNVFIASNQIIRLTKENAISKSSRIINFVEYTSRLLIPSKYLSEKSNLGSYAYKYYKQSLGGGFIASYFYFWFGIWGVIALAIILAKFICNIKEYNSNYKIIFITINIAFFPRWIAYEPIQIIKLPVIGVIIYFIFRIFDYILKKGDIQIE